MSRRRTFLTALALFGALTQPATAYEQQVRTLCAALSERLAASGKKTVAVVDFTDLDGNVTWLGRFLAEEVSVGLAMSAKGFEVIERTQLKAILKEHKLAATGIIDPQTARKMGEIVGVDVIITGTVTPVGESVRMTAKALDAGTARMVTAQTADIPRTKAIADLAERGVAGASVVSTGGGTAEGPLPTSQASPSVAVPPQTAQGIKMHVEKCRDRGDAVACDLTVTSLDEDSEVLFEKYISQGFDERGTKLGIASASLGGVSNGGIKLVAGIATDFTVTFAPGGGGFGGGGRTGSRAQRTIDGIVNNPTTAAQASPTRALSLIELHLSSRKFGEAVFRFRKVPVTAN